MCFVHKAPPLMVADARVERALARVKALCVPVSPIGNIKAPHYCEAFSISFSEKNKSVLDNLKDTNPTVVFLSKDILTRVYREVYKELGSMPRIRKMKILIFISNILKQL